MQQIAEWLKRLDLSEYAERFAENGIDISVLPHLTDQDLKEMGVLLGHRRKMLAAIRKSSSKPPAPAPATATGTPIIPAPMPAAEAMARQTAPTTEAAGERRYLTVMFCDLVGSTAISAQLDAEEWRDLSLLSRHRFRCGRRNGRSRREKTWRRLDVPVWLSAGA